MLKAPPAYKGLAKAKSVVGGKPSAGPIGQFQIGKRTSSSKVNQIFGRGRM